MPGGALPMEFRNRRFSTLLGFSRELFRLSGNRRMVDFRLRLRRGLVAPLETIGDLRIKARRLATSSGSGEDCPVHFRQIVDVDMYRGGRG